MASITTWTRLETRQRSDDLDVSLAARVHDPLWLLARQWQLGEFRGHDSGSPVGITVRATSGRLDRYVTGAVDADAAARSRPYDDASVPLEAVVEAEPLSAQSAPRLAVEAGAHFLRMLKAAGLGRHGDEFVRNFAVASTAPSAEFDPVGRRFHDLVARRLPDGFVLRAALAGTAGVALPPGVEIDPADRDAVVAVGRRWLEWFAAVVDTGVEEDAWVPDRLEYSFAVAATVDGTERVLAAGEYSSGRLDWHDFDVVNEASLGATTAAENILRTVLPAPVTYPGMPAPRFWAFEDARIDLGSVDAGADNIARMLLIGFAVDYGNDWFVVPVELPVGSITGIQALDVTDTFGVRTRVRAAAEVDGPGAAWRMYGLSAGGGDPEGLFFLPPVLAGSLEGLPRERVAFARDEFANLVWAIEDVVESSTGAPRRRDEEPQPSTRVSGSGDDVLRYEVATGTARHWHPMVAVTDGSGAATLEQRAIHPGVGIMLGAELPLRLHEEELPGEGLGVERTFQLARWIGGRTVVGPAAIGRKRSRVERTAFRRRPPDTRRAVVRTVTDSEAAFRSNLAEKWRQSRSQARTAVTLCHFGVIGW